MFVSVYACQDAILNSEILVPYIDSFLNDSCHTVKLN